MTCLTKPFKDVKTIALGAAYIWMQLKVINEEAAAKAGAAGATVIMDRCPAIELPRLQAAVWDHRHE